MPTIPESLRKTRTLAEFAYRARPLIWRRMSEDRKRAVQPAPRVPRLSAWTGRAGIQAAWIGHSTVLLEIDGFRIITDPVFSTRIGVKLGPYVVGMKRLVYPAVPLAELPRPDLILLSHAHMDHFDLPTLRLLGHAKTAVVTAAHTSDLLRVNRYKSVQELKWDQACQVGPAKIRAFEVKHWGARTRTDVHRGYNGYSIEVGRHRIVFGGDTAYTDLFRRIRGSKAVDLAIMPIGAYNPWVHAHCNPEEALRMANDCGADFVLPVHHQTFLLGNEGYREPIERFQQAAGPAQERVAAREIGDEFFLNRA